MTWERAKTVLARGQASESPETVGTRAELCGGTKGRQVSVTHQESHLK